MFVSYVFWEVSQWTCTGWYMEHKTGLNYVYRCDIVSIYWFCTILFSCKSQFAVCFMGCEDILDLIMNGIYPTGGADAE